MRTALVTARIPGNLAEMPVATTTDTSMGPVDVAQREMEPETGQAVQILPPPVRERGRNTWVTQPDRSPRSFDVEQTPPLLASLSNALFYQTRDLLTHPMASYLHTDTDPHEALTQIQNTIAQLPPQILQNPQYHPMILAAARSAFLYGEENSFTLNMLFSALSLNLSPSETLELITRVYQNEA